jgi:hypothetical protein
MKDVEYVHYGSTTFDPKLVGLIDLPRPVNKPDRGLWASPCDDSKFYTWKDFCIESDMFRCDDDLCFKFKVRDDAKIITIDKPSAFKKYVDNKVLTLDNPLCDCGLRSLSFPESIYEKYDGIELIHGEYYAYFHDIFLYGAFHRITDAILLTESDDKLVDKFYQKTSGVFNSWDCDSICIWNPDMIEIIK